MKILVVGASKGTGAACVASGLARGHHVTAFSRSPSKLAIEHANLSRVAGDFHDPDSVNGAVKGHDAVIVSPGVSSLSEFKTKPDYFSRGTKFCIDAMKASGVKRIVVLSALGAGDSKDAMGWFLKAVMINGILKRAYADHDVQEALTKASDLEWVIARPTRLTDGPANGKYVREENPMAKVPSSISRADVADFMIEACSSEALARKTVGLGG